MFKIEIIDSQVDRYREYGLLFIRLALGAVFLAHGSQKLFGLFGGHGLSGTIGFMDMMGLKPAAFWGTLLACGEFFGGLLALLGLLTRWAGLCIATIMSVAIFTVHLKNGFFLDNKGIEFAFSLLCMAMALVFFGGGKFSLDDLLWNKER